MYRGGLLKRIDTKRLAKLLAHELFHVLTRDNKEFRKSMYEIIGFKILNKEIKFADDIKIGSYPILMLIVMTIMPCLL